MTVTVRNRGRRFEGYASACGRSVRRSGFDTWEAAESWAKRREAELQGGEVPPGSPVETWGELVDWAWQHHYKDTKSAKVTRSLLNSADAYFGASCVLRSIGAPKLLGYVEHLRSRGDAAATVLRKLAVVQKLLRLAHDQGWIEVIPKGPGLPKQTKGRVRWITEAEQRSLLLGLEEAAEQRWHNPDHRDLAFFLVETGCRVSEALGLKWQDYNAENCLGGQVTLWDTKGGGHRTIPLTEIAQGVLEGRNALCSPFGDIDYQRFIRDWNKVRKDMGLQDDPDFVPHVLRHTFASRLVQRGASLLAVQKLLGHSRIEQTLIYAHLAPSDLKAAVDLLDQ